MAPAVSLCRRSAACLVSYSTVSSASASRCVMENNDPRNSPWILHCTETCNYKLCILSDTGSYFSCTRISFAFKMSTPSPRWAALQFSLCPSVPWHMIPPGSRCIPRRTRTWAHTGLCCSQDNSHTWLCCTNPLPTRQPQPAHHTEMPVGSSWSCPAILPLTWPGICLTVRQEILTHISLLCDSRNEEQSCFLALL